MFNPVQIKHECEGIEDVNSDDKVNISNNSKYQTFIEDVDCKYEISQFWNHAQLSNDIHPKNEIHGQYNLFQSEIDMTQKAGQSQFSQNMQTAKFTNQIGTISEPISPIKSNRPGRPPKGSSDSNIGKKLKCQCEICFKEFGHKSNLFIHMRTHSGERPYKCNQCEKCFTHSGNLAIHMRTHSGERPYGCQICGKMFSHSGNLSTHLRTHSGIKPYKCAICNKEFRHSGNLSIHERIHSGIKPFQCKVCGKDFYHSGNLTTHMKKHIVNINTSINQCENNVKQTVCVANLNNTTSINSFNNLALTQSTDIKPMPIENNIVPIKNESNDDELTNAVGLLTPTST
ncbi:Protein glass [Melipona quadrifasciata]|uniref:Protein glass n=1 Tax=Melipona quadrifasciata TaxID=166423 RepID=A0A0M9A0N1_9HYME|nr:Protein glass [Melipona quadrifasciata]